MPRTAPTIPAQPLHHLPHDPDYVISVHRSAHLGMISEEERDTLVTSPTWADVVKLVSTLNARGIGQGLRARLLDHTRNTVARYQATVTVTATVTAPSVWAALAEAIVQRPMPPLVWQQARDLFADDAQLGDLLGVAPSSIVRYTRGERAPKDTQMVERLHALMMIAADLSGTFNDLGVRRWFTRTRTHLGGKSPAQVLSGDWSLDDEAYRQIRALADSDLN